MVQIRKMSEEDIQEVTDILEKYVSFEKASIARTERLFAEGNSYVAVESSEVIGFVSLIDRSEISLLCVKESHRGKGIATSLVNVMVSRYSGDLTAIGWETPCGWGAEKIFTDLGFKPVKRTKDWEDECDSINYCPYYAGSCNCHSKHVILSRDY